MNTKIIIIIFHKILKYFQKNHCKIKINTKVGIKKIFVII